MKALTLTQPWATLVAIDAKRFETRSWRTDYRGPLAIHAAKGLAGMDEAAFVRLCQREPFLTALLAGVRDGKVERQGDTLILPRGAVVAVCDLSSCLKTELLVAQPGGLSTAIWPPLSAQERAFGDYSPGRYAWRLVNVRRLAMPVHARGYQGLWDWTPPAGLLGEN